jgi:nucleoside-diphosphate-sugar epimerase
LSDAAAAGARRFVLASSSSVYGDCPSYNASSEYHKLDPASPYAASKFAAELLAHMYREQMEVVALRYFTVYGPGQRPDMAISQFLRSAIEDKPVTIYGDGGQRRDFTYIDDIVRATIAASEPGRLTGAFNIGSGVSISINSVIALIAGMELRRLRVVYKPKQPGDVERTLANISSAAAHLDYLPEVMIHDGLRRQLESLKTAC